LRRQRAMGPRDQRGAPPAPRGDDRCKDLS
jgi:hypothetical protein